MGTTSISYLAGIGIVKGEGNGEFITTGWWAGHGV